MDVCAGADVRDRFDRARQAGATGGAVPVSRVGRRPITVPQGVDLRLQSGTVTVKGPKGQLEQAVPEGIRIERADGTVRVERVGDDRRVRALHGLTRTLVANMVHGVTEGFTKSLELVGTGYRATKNGRRLVLTVGYSHPVEVEPPPGIEFEAPTVASVTVRGIDKQLVGQTAANIRAVRVPSVYGEGKGIRYVGERVRGKQGKTGK